MRGMMGGSYVVVHGRVSSSLGRCVVSPKEDHLLLEEQSNGFTVLLESTFHRLYTLCSALSPNQNNPT